MHPKWLWMDPSPPTGAMWPIQGCSLLFKKKKKRSKAQSGNELIQQTPTGLRKTETQREGTMKREWRKGRQKGHQKLISSPPVLRPATDNKTRAEEHLLPPSNAQHKGAAGMHSLTCWYYPFHSTGSPSSRSKPSSLPQWSCWNQNQKHV